MGDPGRMLTMTSTVSPVAPRLRTRMKYIEVLAPTGIPTYSYVFRLNSVFDPNLTGTGHQAYGFDQLSALYNRYRVYYCAYDIVSLPTTGAAVETTATATNGSSAIGSVAALEHPWSKRAPISNVYNACRLSAVIDLAQLNGKTAAQYADDDTTGSEVTTNPAEVLALQVNWAALAGANVTADAVVTLVYDVEWSDPQNMSGS